MGNDIKTVLTREQLLKLICDNTGKRINLPNFTIEELEDFAAAVLAASAPAQEPFKWCLRIVRPQEHNYATNDLYNTEAEAEADAARVHASKFHNNVSVFPLYAAPVDAQSAVDAKSAEEYLRNKYGAYRGHFAWRELEDAFNAGKQANPLKIR